jgi:hypothetical protein
MYAKVPGHPLSEAKMEVILREYQDTLEIFNEEVQWGPTSESKVCANWGYAGTWGEKTRKVYYGLMVRG